MRKILGFAAVALFVALAVAALHAGSVSAAPNGVANAPADDAVLRGPGQGPAGPRQPGEGEGEKGRKAVPERLRQAIHHACPCAGPEGEGWPGGQEEYLACVQGVVDKAVEKGLPAKLAEKIMARAAEVDLANCPTPRERPGARKLRLRLALHRACPCAGPEGEGWPGGQEEYLACVQGVVDKAVEKGLPVELAEKIMARAADVDLDNCPTPRGRP